MRVIRNQPIYIGDNIGITPAHAGNTSGLGNLSEGFRDHPRACG